MEAERVVEARLRAARAVRPALAKSEPQWTRLPDIRAARPTRRYRIREDASGRRLVCAEAPTLALRIERGACVSASEARHAPPGTIFLDGAAQGGPFADSARGVFNLDHHDGCVRAFTLSTCEQAMALLLRGLDLRRRDWTLVANDADLDAVLAIWVLLNHARITAGDGAARAEIMPLLRLEGAIDAHGLALQELCAFPPSLLDETRRRMERLRDRERALRAAGSWARVDLLEYVQERLEQIDALVYPEGAFADLLEIEELGREPLAQGSLAVACRARVGIYEVERQLVRLHAPRLGLVVLQQREGVYTLRQTDFALPASLEALYAHLNRVDPAARPRRADRRWGGSAEIGGSPRAGGTRLCVQEILEACRHVYARPPLARRLAQGALACALAVAAPLAALAAFHHPVSEALRHGALGFGSVLALLAAAGFALATRGARALHGWRRPAGLGWLGALPFAAAGALAGGAWAPVTPGGAGLAPALLAAGLSALGAELAFRGMLHGRLTWCAAPRAGASAGLSAATLVSGALYATVSSLLAWAGAMIAAPLAAAQDPAVVWGGALLFGLAAGAARESSGSLAPPVALHVLAAVLVCAAGVSL